MLLCKLLPGEVVTDHFLLQLPGIDDGIAVGFAGFSGRFPEYDRGQCDQDIKASSLSVLTGVPDQT